MLYLAKVQAFVNISISLARTAIPVACLEPLDEVKKEYKERKAICLGPDLLCLYICNIPTLTMSICDCTCKICYLEQR